MPDLPPKENPEPCKSDGKLSRREFAQRAAGYPRHHRLKDGTLIDIEVTSCLLYTSPSPRDGLLSRMPSSA